MGRKPRAAPTASRVAVLRQTVPILSGRTGHPGRSAQIESSRPSGFVRSRPRLSGPDGGGATPSPRPQQRYRTPPRRATRARERWPRGSPSRNSRPTDRSRDGTRPVPRSSGLPSRSSTSATVPRRRWSSPWRGSSAGQRCPRTGSQRRRPPSEHLVVKARRARRVDLKVEQGSDESPPWGIGEVVNETDQTGWRAALKGEVQTGQVHRVARVQR